MRLAPCARARRLGAVCTLLGVQACASLDSRAPILYADPPTVDLAASELEGETARFDVTLVNMGRSELALEEWAWIGDPPSTLVVEIDTDAPLASGEVRIATFRFSPADLESLAGGRLVWSVSATGSSEVGCGASIATTYEVAVPVYLMPPEGCDADLDGSASEACGGDDCADEDATRGPGAAEICNGLDDDCDGLVDEDAVDALDWFEDTDRDGFGTGGSTSACEAKRGFATRDGDCDDLRSDVYPDAPEVCDGADNDCDGDVDEELLLRSYVDRDGDGFGDGGTWLDACEVPSGWTLDARDCDDARADVHPLADEICGGVDEDCDGERDEAGATGGVTGYADVDSDGYGDPNSTADGCAIADGYSAVALDCDDADATTHPGADELCDAIDRDCDGDPVADAVDTLTWWQDDDADGFGTGMDQHSCEVFGADERGDCDDGDALVHPGAVEICNGRDDDCDALVDEDLDADAWYPDMDGDGFGLDWAEVSRCDAPPDHIARGGDCDDTDALVNPEETELCNGNDDDCDGLADDAGASDATTWYADADGDGIGTDPGVQSCVPKDGHVTDPGDCDDADALVYPGAAERCNDVDDNCDGTADEGAPGTATFYRDADADGYGNDADSVTECAQPTGYLPSAGDCDDTDASAHPGGEEVCGGGDEDCDGVVDEWGAEGHGRFYVDGDGDGFGAGSIVPACTNPDPELLVDDSGDCDDENALVHPDAREQCNALDDDCDSFVDESGDEATWYRDDDGDGWGTELATATGCEAPPGYVQLPGDCADGDPSIHPEAYEICADDLDNDCDGETDETTDDASTWYADRDGDGFGDPGSTSTRCDPPDGYVGNALDCDDTNANTRPGADELCDTLDNDCDGEVDEATYDGNAFYRDGDGDGHGTPDDIARGCAPPPGYVVPSDDCDDDSVSVHPDATEVCNDRDDDCDGRVDDVAAGIGAWIDADLDGYGDPERPHIACAIEPGLSARGDDCDDTTAATHPGAAEACNGADDDCDGAVPPNELDGDGDGFSTCRGDCDDTSSATHPGAAEACNGADDDCDGTVPPNESDSDRDSYRTCAGDCDDSLSSVHPGATEVCDGRDDDCEGTLPATEADADADTFRICEGDCDDSSSTTHPGATEACNGGDDDCDGTVPPTEADADGDSYRTCAGDCDDSSATTHPGAAEACNGADDDCDGALPTTESDADGDTFRVCDGDCDDTAPTIHPGATEACNGADDDCNGTVPANESDADGDTYRTCAGDCDDATSTVHPGATEVCNGTDDDCDGALPATESDADADEFRVCDGDCDDTDEDVHPGAGEECNGRDDDCDGALPTSESDADDDDFRVCEGDCDDSSPATHPGAGELCDRTDNDCDRVIPADEQDEDGDAIAACEGDCDDLSDEVFPGADESCNGADDDCDGTVPTTESDADLDGYLVCDGDCDDSDASVHPGAEEDCNGADDDCDGLLPGEEDLDFDGFPVCAGDCDDTREDAFPGADEVCNALDDDCDDVVPGDESDSDDDAYRGCDGDCDDDRPDVHPDAVEVLCDGVDNDCDGDFGEDDEEDGDGDGVSACNDCDDADASVFPGAPEQCNGVDDDCNGLVDDDVDVDLDGDGFSACDGDCNDLDALVHPGADEVCDLRDDDCDGVLPLDEQDEDGDAIAACEGDCDDLSAEVFPGADESCNGADDDCDGAVPTTEDDADLDGYLVCDGDCDDADASVHPGAEEDCNGADDDCDGLIPGEEDQDFDGFAACAGDCDDTREDAFPGADEVCNALDDDCDAIVPGDESDSDGDAYRGCDGDCDDDRPDVNPDADEVLCDGVDNDCDGDFGEDDEQDGDGDGVGACDDCDDSDASVFPGAPERCNGEDDDCDGLVDDDVDVDVDGDGYAACDGDCNDLDALVHPGADEVCDYLDQDCDGGTDEDFRRGGRYTADEHCGFCDNDCTIQFENAVGSCDTSASFPTCTYTCEPGFFDVNALPDDGCECVFLSEDDPPFDGIDANCDGYDGSPFDAIHVSTEGSPLGTGTPWDPVDSVARGLSLAESSGIGDVHVASGTYFETVTLADGINLTGGWDHDFLVRDPDSFPTTIDGTGGNGRPTVVAFRVTSDTLVAGFEIIGRPGTEFGSEAIGIWVELSSSALTLSDNRVIALDGRNGSVGPDGADGRDGVRGGDGQAGYAGWCPDLPVGGRGARFVCDGVMVDGGDGADTTCPVEYEYQPSGERGSGPSGGFGGGGGCAAGGADFCWSCWIYDCVDAGGRGGAGGAGYAGGGGLTSDSTVGSFSTIALNGWTPAGGYAGWAAGPGSGGGGGGTGSPADFPDSTCWDQFGGTGAGGGSGGCGGHSGQGGGGGGASIALVIYGGELPTLIGNTFDASDGGPGGRGGDGGRGGIGGQGGIGGEQDPIGGWCTEPGGDGGDGGNGGGGGGGGGGNGGPSIAIYRASGPLPSPSWPDSTNVLSFGYGGDGGDGGNGTEGARNGRAGLRGEEASKNW